MGVDDVLWLSGVVFDKAGSLDGDGLDEAEVFGKTGSAEGDGPGVGFVLASGVGRGLGVDPGRIYVWTCVCIRV